MRLPIHDRVHVSMFAIDVAQAIFDQYNLLLMEFGIYKCEERAHFAEAKKKEPKARRSPAEALQHTPDSSEPTILIQRAEDLDKIRELIGKLKEIDPATAQIASYVGPEDKSRTYVHEALKMISRVRTMNGIFHIPLLDLDIATDEYPSDIVFPYIKDVAQLLGVGSGAVINSGKSYHLWGLDLMSKNAWYDFMFNALLLDRIDRRWVAHRLKDGQANIRISPKWAKMPRVAYVF